MNMSGNETQMIQTFSISMEDLTVWIPSTSSNFITPPPSPNKTFLRERNDLHDKSKPRPIPYSSGFMQHHRSHSDTLCSVPDAVESLSISPEYWVKYKEEMEVESEGGDVSLVDEIHQKYNCEQGLFACQSTVFMKLSSPTRTQLPGMRSPSGALQLLVLNKREISVTGKLSELSQLVCNLKELDLADNALSDLNEVCKLFSVMPQLSHCNLSHNPFNRSRVKQSSFSFLPPSLPEMRILILNASGISWSALFSLLKAMPNLEELHLSLNDYSTGKSLPSPDSSPTFSSIHIVHLNSCRIKEWNNLLQICTLFPSLQVLVAAQNPISNIDQREKSENEKISSLTSLHCLNCNRWEISSWEEIEKLRNLPTLTELRATKLPLLAPYSEEERRHLLVARLPEIVNLNGSQVTLEQRITAERFFLRHYAGTFPLPSRYAELEQVHGQLEPLPHIDLSPEESVNVIIFFDDKKENRHIDLNQTVGKLKKELESFCGIPSHKFRLFYRDMDAQGVFGDEELKFPKKILWTLKIRDGDQFHIQEKLEQPPRRRTSSNSQSSGSKSCD